MLASYAYGRYKKRKDANTKAASPETVEEVGSESSNSQQLDPGNDEQGTKGTEHSTVDEKTPDEKDAAAPAHVRSKEEKHAARVYRWKLIASLFFPQLVATIDLTIVATAMPYIASDFNKLPQQNWIATAYALTSTSFIPVFGQLADIFGRHAVLQLAMILMTMGSTLCAAAQTWGMLLFGRALQGMSAAGLMNIIKIVLADKVSLAENAKNTSIFTFVGGISYSIGPLIGGYLTNANWRYCFVISIPISLLASAIIFVLIRKELQPGSHSSSVSWRKPTSILPALATIDVGGTVLFFFGVGMIILATAWGGTTYAWHSAAVLVPLILGPILFLAFFAYEYLLEPGRLINRIFPLQIAMIPWSLFSRLDTFFLAVINFSSGAALYSAFYFVSIYFTLVAGYPASRSGIQLLYYIPGLGIGSYLAMAACNFWPGQTFWPLWIGSMVEALGIGLLIWAVTTQEAGLVNGIMAVAGLGTGLRFMPGTLHGVGTWPNRTAAVLSIMDFAVPFGGTIALTVMGSVFSNKFFASVHSIIEKSGSQLQNVHLSNHTKIGISAIKELPPLIQREVRHGAAQAVMWAFVSIMPLMACCVLAASSLGNVWVRGRATNDRTADVIYESYLLALFTGTIRSKRTANMAQGERTDAVEPKDAGEVEG